MIYSTAATTIYPYSTMSRTLTAEEQDVIHYIDGEVCRNGRVTVFTGGTFQKRSGSNITPGYSILKTRFDDRNYYQTQ